MVFTSHIFIFYFLPLALAGYYALPARSSWRNAWLVMASYVFYGWWDPRFLLLMIGVTAICHAAGMVIARHPPGARARRLSLAAAVGLSLAALGFFKYFTFAASNVSALSQALGGPAFAFWQVALPVGISFYTFQAISYCVDVYRGHAPPARSPLDFACYIALFPQLVAGPIVRYQTVARQLEERRFSLAQFASGVALFILGFAKKVLLANPIASVADLAFGARAPDAACAWIGAIAYALQIYFDFCGYSDMAVGLGRMFGFAFQKNFNAPYHADSITDFWRRWHISLSTFLRDYLYIPLGGNRLGRGRTYTNLVLVMLLGGLWHGANWTYLAWGAWHGALLIAERWAGKKPAYQRLPRAFRVMLTFVLVLGSWVWFRAESLPAALDYFRAMLGLGSPDETTALLAAQVFAPAKLIFMSIAALLLLGRRQAHDWSETLTWPKSLILVPAFALALAMLFTQSFNPFLYFQF